MYVCMLASILVKVCTQLRMCRSVDGCCMNICTRMLLLVYAYMFACIYVVVCVCVCVNIRRTVHMYICMHLYKI